jgi:hypothetical protein
VPFKPGMNTDTYKFYIDFAARFGIEYVILDEGWYKTGDLLQVVTAGLDMPQLLAYARAQERRHHSVGGVEDAGGSAASRRWRSSSAGASRG